MRYRNGDNLNALHRLYQENAGHAWKILDRSWEPWRSLIGDLSGIEG